MGKDRRKDKEDEDDSLGKKKDKHGKKGDGTKAPTQGPDKSFSHQECRHILVQKQSDALRISEMIHDGKITFNEAAFQHSEDKAGAHGLLGWKAQHEVCPHNRYSLLARSSLLHACHEPCARSSTKTFGRPRSHARRATGCASR